MSQISICSYKNNAHGAVSLTFDDGWKKEVEDATEVIETHNLRGTFFIMPYAMANRPEATVSWPRVNALISKGHEIGTHGTTKEKLHEATPERLQELINGSHHIIQEQTGLAPLSYARPGGSKGTPPVLQVIHEQHLFHRTENKEEKVATIGYGNTDFRSWSDQETRDHILAATSDGSWLIPVIHGIEDGYSHFASKEEFSEHCAWLANQHETIWCAPMKEVGAYKLAAKHAEIQIISEDATQLHLQLTNKHTHDYVRSFPLTLKISQCPGTVNEAEQGVRKLSHRIDGDHVYVDAIPNKEIITLHFTS